MTHPLRTWQTEALAALESAWGRNERPLLHACTGAGKSRLLAEICSRTMGKILLTTPTQALVDQLSATIAAHCGRGQVGRVYQYAYEPNRRIVVTCHNSLAKALSGASYDVWLADEAHRLEGDDLRTIQQGITASLAAGLTATPFRGDQRGLQTWTELAYSYTSHDAVRDGVLVPWRVVRWDGTGTDDTDDIVAGWVRGAGGRGIVSAVSISDAEEYAAKLGSNAAAVHSRLPKSEITRRVKQLANGELQCLVHVNLLTEGIDLPWLEWLALRRRVSSPVRLVQEVGRVLRASPGKTHATLYDPHDALGALGLTHAAALEDAQRADRQAGTAEEWEMPPELMSVLGDAQIPRAVAVDRISGEICDLLARYRAAGQAEPPKCGEGPWRQKRATKAQRDALGRMKWAVRFLEPAHKPALEWAISQTDLRAGTASDALGVLWAARRVHAT